MRLTNWRRIVKSASAAVRGFSSANSGGVALMFAITVIPIVGVIGLAIDLSLVTQSKTRLNSAAGAAALAAVKTSADAFTAGRQDYIALGETAGLQWFRGQSAGQNIPTVAVNRSGAIFSSAVTYQDMVPTYFARLFGFGMVSVGGTSSATIATTAYVSVTFMLDNSSSMLIAATQVGVDLMHAITPAQAKNLSVPNGLGGAPCAFACHWDQGGQDYYGVARDHKILLRFDLVQSAVQTALTEMINEELIDHQFGISIYTFSNSLTPIYPINSSGSTTTNLAGAIPASRSIRAVVVPYQGNTNFPAAMASLAHLSTAAGSGSTAASPKKVLIIITDGLADYGSRTTPTKKGPFDPVSCATMKQMGFAVYLFYIDYIITPPDLLLPIDNIGLLPFIKGTTSPLRLALQSCASGPDNVVQASDPAGVAAAMKRLLQAALATGARFTD